MKTTAAALDRFEKVPLSALTEITPAESGGSIGNSLLSDEDIFKTGEHAQTSLFPNNSDTPNNPTGEIGSSNVPTSQPGIKLGSTVSGKFVVDMTDIILPALLVWVVSMIGYGIDKKQLALTAKEKETLTPLVQAYLDSINVNFNNPLNNLLFGVAMVYGSKVIEIIPNVQKLERKGKPNPKVSPSVKALTNVAERINSKINEGKTTDEIITEIGNKRKKGLKDAIEYFNSNKKKFGKENEPDINLP